MSKVLKVAAIVVGVAAVALSAGTVLFGAAAVASTLGIGAGALATIGTVLSVSSAVLGLAAGVLAKKPKLSTTGGGSQLDFVADPAAGEPYVVGDAMVGMAIVHEASWGSKNRYLGMVGVISVCTIMAYDGLYADMTQISFSGRNATGYYANFMYLSTQLGAMPEGTALDMTAPDASQMPDWGSAYKTSGLATAGLVLVADVDKGKVYSGGTPKLTHRVRGVKAYDARLDSTQSGGSGSQRPLTESTYAYSENPWVHAETYALGRWQNGIRVIGPGLSAAQIDFGAYMEAANIADANGWKISGQVYSTDLKWDALKAMAQAGGGYPMPTGAHLSALVNTPKVSLATVTEADVKGPVTAPQMLTRRDRLNGAIPRFRSAAHGWEVVPGNVVRNSTYLAADGGNEKTREIELTLVADKGDGNGLKQAAQLAAYEVANSRERSPISVELGYAWSQYKLGDCLTLNLPSANLANQKAVIIGRSINAGRNTVTFEFRTEDDAKHTWALAQTGSVSTPPTVVQAPGQGDGVLTSVQLQNLIINSQVRGLTFSVSPPSGGNVTVNISSHTRVYSDKTVTCAALSGFSLPASTGDIIVCWYVDNDRTGATGYGFSILTGGAGDPSLFGPSPSNPGGHTVFIFPVPAAGATPAPGVTDGGSDLRSGGGAYVGRSRYVGSYD